MSVARWSNFLNVMIETGSYKWGSTVILAEGIFISKFASTAGGHFYSALSFVHYHVYSWKFSFLHKYGVETLEIAVQDTHSSLVVTVKGILATVSLEFDFFRSLIHLIFYIIHSKTKRSYVHTGFLRVKLFISYFKWKKKKYRDVCFLNTKKWMCKCLVMQT